MGESVSQKPWQRPGHQLTQSPAHPHLPHPEGPCARPHSALTAWPAATVAKSPTLMFPHAAWLCLGAWESLHRDQRFIPEQYPSWRPPSPAPEASTSNWTWTGALTAERTLAPGAYRVWQCRLGHMENVPAIGIGACVPSTKNRTGTFRLAPTALQELARVGREGPRQFSSWVH